MDDCQTRPRQACDSCRFRKVKCDRGQPCKNCHVGALRCKYAHSIRRKGPRSGQGIRQVQIRRGLSRTSPTSDVFRVFTPITPSDLNSQGQYLSTGSVSSQDEQLPGEQTCTPWTWPFESVSSAGPETVNLSDICDGTRPSPNQAELDVAADSKRLSLSLAAHIQVFFKFLFPIMPIAYDTLATDALRIDELPPSRYAVILALCAATRMQLRMDNTRNGLGEGPDAYIPVDPQLTGEMLVELAEKALREYNVIDDLSLDSIMASFFLFASYGNLNNARHAWFYLNQSISLAQSLDITTESGYRGLDETECEKRRRVFWLLFVTERTFALQHRRGVQLCSSSILKPQIVDSDCPTVMNDFVNHIRVFEQLPSSLYVWQTQSDNSQLSLTHTINENLCAVQSDQSVIESQRFDTLLTQQWLRVAMWRLAFGNKPSSSHSRGMLLPPALPMEAGKFIMGALTAVAQNSKDCHGIGLEQKLFDVGISLADSARLSVWRNSTMDVGPRDLLACIVQDLSKIRGCCSHLLPNLLEHSEDLLNTVDPLALIDAHWQMQRDPCNSDRNTFVEEMAVPEDPIGDFIWPAEEDMEILNLHTPMLRSLCHDTASLGASLDYGNFA